METKNEGTAILCVCTGNTCRSPMMAALLRQKLDRRDLKHVVVESAGLDTDEGKPASDGAIAEMVKRGLDISAHRNRLLDNLAPLKRFDRILCANQKVVDIIRDFYPKNFPGVVPLEKLEIVDEDQGGIADPYKKGPEVYAACAAQIEAAMERIAEEIAAELATRTVG